jgi:hydroxymethylpyrimidine/phosphomethylpyrimidine kinase
LRHTLAAADTEQIMIPIALTIAGSDSSGGAGIQADLKTFSALGTYGASVITALTAQNTLGVSAIHAVPGDFVTAQLDAVFDDLDIKAIKVGMVGSIEVVSSIADKLSSLEGISLVLDPVMVATSGDPLLDADTEQALRERLIPLAALITPNLEEAARLLGGSVSAASEEEMKQQAKRIMGLGPDAVLVKGGNGEGDEAVDILWDGEKMTRLTAARIETDNIHGTGCTLSSAIVGELAKGHPLDEACANAKKYLTSALAASDDLEVGQGSGPVHHFFDLWKK